MTRQLARVGVLFFGALNLAALVTVVAEGHPGWLLSLLNGVALVGGLAYVARWGRLSDFALIGAYAGASAAVAGSAFLLLAGIDIPEGPDASAGRARICPPLALRPHLAVVASSKAVETTIGLICRAQPILRVVSQFEGSVRSASRATANAGPVGALGPRDGTLLGALFEALVTLDVRAYAQAGEARVRHFRDRNGEHEVDLIVERADGRVLAIEVKLSRSITDGDVSTSAG